MRALMMLWMSLFSNQVTTEYVNSLEQQLGANRIAYLSGPHTPERQQQALAFYDKQWAWLKSADACGSATLGQSGIRCIGDRTRGGRWPWEAYYRDPILKAPFDPELRR